MQLKEQQQQFIRTIQKSKERKLIILEIGTSYLE